MKKNIYSLFIFFCFSLAWINSYASHFTGGEITYTCTSTPGVWQITLTIYVDCSGTPLCSGTCNSTCAWSVNITAADSGTYSTIAYLSLVSVSDVDPNPLCPSSKSLCTNNGCNTAGTFTPGLEKYVFQGNVDLGPSSSIPAYVCNVRISTTACCRTATSTGASSGDYFYVEAILNRCLSNSPCNSAPILTNDPVVVICGGQTFQFNMGAIDPDHDSLSYAFTPSLTGANISRGYTSPYSATRPFPYYPPATSPLPLGINCDPITGDIGFTPSYGAGGQFVGTIAVQINQWKKIAGIYRLVGTTMRDNIMYLISCPPDNNPKIMTNPSIGNQPKVNWKIESGQSLCFNVIGKDTDFNTTSTPIISDTTYLSWNNALASKGATFLPTYNTANRTTNGPREDTYQFCWTPDTTMVSNIPWLFTVKAIDNKCPYAGKTTRSFSITVVGTPNATIIKTPATCYKWNLSYTTPHPEYISSQQWMISNTKNSFNNSDYSSFTTSSITNYQFNDTGRFVVKLILTGDNSLGTITTIFDTINNHLIFKLAPLLDTTLCPGPQFYKTIQAKHVGGKLPLTTIWFDTLASTILSTTDFLTIQLNISKNYLFIVTDSAGCSFTDFSNIIVYPWPVISPSVSVTICQGSSYTFDAGNNNGNIKKYHWNSGDTTRTVTKFSGGVYSATITDTLGCIRGNSNTLSIKNLPPTNAGNDTTICFGKSVSLHVSGANLFQWSALPSPIVIGYTSSISVAPDSSTTYRVFGTDTLNGLSCSNADTVKVIVTPKLALPSIVGPSSVNVNQLNSFSVTNHTGSIFNWFLDGNLSSGQGTNTVNAKFTTVGSSQINVAEMQNNCWSDTASKGITVNAVGGINEQAAFENFNVYPNPTSGLLNIEFETSGKIIELELFDILGRSALKGTLQHAGGLFQHAININDLNRGVYFLKISAEGKSATVKVTLK
jgi:hypothetical protein